MINSHSKQKEGNDFQMGIKIKLENLLNKFTTIFPKIKKKNLQLIGPCNNLNKHFGRKYPKKKQNKCKLKTHSTPSTKRPNLHPF